MTMIKKTQVFFLISFSVCLETQNDVSRFFWRGSNSQTPKKCILFRNHCHEALTNSKVYCQSLLLIDQLYELIISDLGRFDVRLNPRYAGKFDLTLSRTSCPKQGILVIEITYKSKCVNKPIHYFIVVCCKTKNIREPY